MRKRLFAVVAVLILMTSFIAGAFSAVKKGDDFSEAFDRGNEAFYRGAYERAIFEYRSVLVWPGQHESRARFNIGVCHHKLGRLSEAVSEYRAAIKGRSGKYPMASYALGVALQSLREDIEARAAFAQAVEASGGKHAEALFELGPYAQAERDAQAAVDFYARSIKQRSAGRGAAGV